LYDEGILITNIHEFSMSSIPGAPPIHMERPIFPFDAIANATLKPGDIWTYNPWGLSVRFNGYTDGGGCSVSVASLATLPPAPSRKVRFAGSVTPPWVSQPGKSTISADIGLDGLVFGAPFIGGPLPVNSLWPGHNNPVTVRVHAATPGTISNVNVGVKMSQPAVVASHCDVLPATTMSASIPEIPAAGNASTTMNWIAGTSGSVSVEAVATAPGNQALATTAYAYQFHHADALFNGQTTQFMVAADSSCGAPDMLYIRP
jgi:hypothetical protein